MIKLNIQRFADIIGYIPIKATPTGEDEATTGAGMQEAFNTNFANTTDAINSIFTILQQVVSSATVTMIKADTQNRFYYSTDDIDTPPESITWVPVAAVFANIQGNPTDNQALADALASKAPISVLDRLTTDEGGTLPSGVSILSNYQGMTQNTTNIGINTANINSISNTLQYTVRTDGVQTPLYLKYDTTQSIVYISTDGSTWVDINSLNTSWSSIAGNVTDNQDLVDYISGQINAFASTLSGVYATVLDLTSHTEDTNNPHEVTKDQIGLGDVDNTSDEDKPLSSAMRDKFVEVESTRPEAVFLNQVEYRQLFSTTYNEVPSGEEVDPTVEYYTYDSVERQYVQLTHLYESAQTYYTYDSTQQTYNQVTISAFEPGIVYYVYYTSTQQFVPVTISAFESGTTYYTKETHQADPEKLYYTNAYFYLNEED